MARYSMQTGKETVANCITSLTEGFVFLSSTKSQIVCPVLEKHDLIIMSWV